MANERNTQHKFKYESEQAGLEIHTIFIRSNLMHFIDLFSVPKYRFKFAAIEMLQLC